MAFLVVESASVGAAARLPRTIGPYQILGVLGRGGMAVVFDALSPTGARVALKVTRAIGEAERVAVITQRFSREAKILEELSHPSIVGLVDSGDEDGLLYLAMECIEGISLLTLRRQGPLDFEPLLDLGIQLAGALEHMHQAGVIHRDIKPANILIREDGTPVITDFGISGMEKATGITQQGDLLGSPGFMAPEIIEGRPPSAQSDQFALGRLLYELGAHGAAARLPQNAPLLKILEAAQKIDWKRFPEQEDWPQLKKILRRMLSERAEDRYPSAKAFGDALKTLSKADLLSSNTLVEHVERLEIQPTVPWIEEGTDAQIPDSFLESLHQPAGGIRESVPQSISAPAENPPELAAELLVPLDKTTDTEIPTGRRKLTLPPVGRVPVEPTAEVIEADSTQTEIDSNAEKELGSFWKQSSSAAKDDTAPPGTDPELPVWAENQLKALKKQVRRLQEEAQVNSVTEKKPKNALTRPQLALGTFLVLLIGLLSGFLLTPKPTIQPQIYLISPGSSGDSEAAAKTGPEKAKDRDVVDAQAMWKTAQEKLLAQDLEGAKRMLHLCIQIADLPRCHRSLASIYSLLEAPEARGHWQHYLRLAPDGPEAPAIRRALGGS